MREGAEYKTSTSFSAGPVDTAVQLRAATATYGLLQTSIACVMHAVRSQLFLELTEPEEPVVNCSGIYQAQMKSSSTSLSLKQATERVMS